MQKHKQIGILNRQFKNSLTGSRFPIGNSIAVCEFNLHSFGVRIFSHRFCITQPVPTTVFQLRFELIHASNTTITTPAFILNDLALVDNKKELQTELAATLGEEGQQHQQRI